MTMISTILNVLGIGVDQYPTGANAVVTDYEEKNNLSEQSKEVTATWDKVERLADEGYFNSVTVANIHFDLGEYGEKVVTLNLEDELPEFMHDLNLDVGDLPMLTEGDYNIPMVRQAGEWRIKWEELEDWALYSPDDDYDVEANA